LSRLEQHYLLVGKSLLGFPSGQLTTSPPPPTSSASAMRDSNAEHSKMSASQAAKETKGRCGRSGFLTSII